MKVILLADIYKHGVAGEVINVTDGFARNYLLPKGLAAKATEGQMRKAAHLREQSQVRRAQYENKLNELARAIDSVELIFGRRAASTGTLFGSVTTQQIADALLEKTGVDINRRRISQIPLREVGVHEVPVRLGTENPPILQINIMRQEDFDEMINAQQRAKAEAAAAAAEPVEELETIESHESIETTVAVEADVPAEEAATE